MKLFKTLLLLTLVAAIVPTAMVGWMSVRDARELLVQDAQELAQERVKQLRLKTTSIVEEPLAVAVGLTRVRGFFQLPLEDQRAQLAQVLNQRRELSVLTVFDLSGARVPGLQAFAVQDVPPSEVAEHQAQAIRLIPTGTALRFSEVYQSPSRHEPLVTAAFPLGSPVRGYGAVEISVKALRELLTQERVGSSGFVYLVDRHGHLVAGGQALGGLSLGTDVSARPAVADLLSTLRATPDADAIHVGNFGQGDKRVVGAYALVPELGWGILSEQPVELAYLQAGTMRRRVVVGVGLGCLVALLLAAVFSRSVTKPIRRFREGAMELAAGKFGVQVPLRSKNELGDLAKTFNYMSQQLSAYDQETRRLYESLEEGYLQTIVALANSIDSKDAYTRGHSQRVADVSVEIGRELGMTERELKHLQYGGILHDVGKIGIVESILCKQSRLTDEEMVIMRGHPEIGDSIVAPVGFLNPVRAAIRNHHERWDGTGYPDKLKGEDIPIVARIVNCADTFDACTSTRPYQKAMPLEKALEILENLRGTQLDPKVLDALRRVVEKKGVRLEGQKRPVKLAS